LFIISSGSEKYHALKQEISPLVEMAWLQTFILQEALNGCAFDFFEACVSVGLSDFGKAEREEDMVKESGLFLW
jgi:hypothetical protein